jgi:NifU-like protein involved in Fe-S cluster formation
MAGYVRQRLVAVAYDFDARSAQPRSQESNEPKTGFRVRFAGLACADRITLTLKFDDGGLQQVAVDGCRIVS